MNDMTQAQTISLSYLGKFQGPRNSLLNQLYSTEGDIEDFNPLSQSQKCAPSTSKPYFSRKSSVNTHVDLSIT